MSVYGGGDAWSSPTIPAGERDQLQLWRIDCYHFTFIRTLTTSDRAVGLEEHAGGPGDLIEEVER